MYALYLVNLTYIYNLSERRNRLRLQRDVCLSVRRSTRNLLGVLNNIWDRALCLPLMPFSPIFSTSIPAVWPRSLQYSPPYKQSHKVFLANALPIPAANLLKRRTNICSHYSLTQLCLCPCSSTYFWFNSHSSHDRTNKQR